MTKIITDREIQLARERAFQVSDGPLVEMLQQLLDFRRVTRSVISNHDYRNHWNKEMPHLDTLVHHSGCEWWCCTDAATTRRMRKGQYHGEASQLCCAHADEGERQGMWDDHHAMNEEWVRADIEQRQFATRVRETIPSYTEITERNSERG